MSVQSLQINLFLEELDMDSFETSVFSYNPLGTCHDSPTEAVSRASLLVRRVSQVGILLVILSAVAHSQEGPAADALVKQAAELAAKGGAENLSRAFRLYEQAAMAGNADAMNETGECYSKGTGVAKDLNKTFQWFERGASADNPKAMGNLGVCYRDGIGVAKSTSKALEWLHRGAKMGDGRSIHSIGVCYAKGEGVPRDPTLAVE